MYYTGYKTFCKRIVFKCVTQDIRPYVGVSWLNRWYTKYGYLFMSCKLKDIELTVGIGCKVYECVINTKD